jgi:hypothetical protein
MFGGKALKNWVMRWDILKLESRQFWREMTQRNKPWLKICCCPPTENIHDSWCDYDINGDYNPTIASAMHHHRFLEIRRNQKINDNQTQLLHDHPNHDPCAKFRLVWDTFEHNKNALISKASLDMTINETTWSNMSYGGLALSCVRGKLGVTKGGQNVIRLASGIWSGGAV